MDRDELQLEGWDWDPVEEARFLKSQEPCSCGQPGVGSMVQCDRHHGIGCYCLACV